MEGYKILIVEDDESILNSLKVMLEDLGAVITVNKTGENVIEQAPNQHMILMDIMLPFNDGFSITHDIKNKIDLPIIFLTARNDIDSKVKGLTSGEDYITKPFHPLELISRINNLLERHYGRTSVKIGHLLVDEKHSKVFKNDGPEIDFTYTEQAMFFYLFKNMNITLTKNQIIEYVWPDGDVFDNILSVYIKKIRNKIDDKNGEIIKTMHGLGYRMVKS